MLPISLHRRPRFEGGAKLNKEEGEVGECPYVGLQTPAINHWQHARDPILRHHHAHHRIRRNDNSRFRTSSVPEKRSELHPHYTMGRATNRGRDRNPARAEDLQDDSQAMSIGIRLRQSRRAQQRRSGWGLYKAIRLASPMHLDM